MLTSFNNQSSRTFKSTDVSLTKDTWAKALPEEIWIEIASLLSPQDLENFKQACKTFFKIGQSDKISKVSHDLLYSRLCKLDPSLPKDLLATDFQAQYQNDLSKVTQKITDEIAYLREHHSTLVKKFIDTLNLEKLAPLQRLEKLSNALDDLNVAIIKPLIDKNSTTLFLSEKAITRIPRKLIQDDKYQSFWQNLYQLDCSRNRFTALNVQGLAALKRLHCESSQLIVLDVQGLAELEYLYCNNNQLTVLNVQGLAALEYLHCYNNQLTALNVQGLAALKGLYCNNNKLTGLDTQGLAAFIELYCSSNQLTALNVQRLIALEYLDCNNNQLTMLPHELVTKFGERWAEDTLSSQRKLALPSTLTTQTSVDTFSRKKHVI